MKVLNIHAEKNYVSVEKLCQKELLGVFREDESG